MDYKAAYQNVENVFNRYGDLGSQDTEPQSHKEFQIMRYMKGQSYCELDVDQWEMYEGGGAKRAVRSMNTAMKKLREAIANTKVEDFAEMIRFFKSKFNYFDLDGHVWG